ncbi:MAG: ribose-phosphate diphosphokinase [Candidatus Methanofastidiosia archaeon]
MRVIIGPKSELLETLAKKLEIPKISCEMRVFPDGEVCPRIPEIQEFDKAYVVNQMDYSKFDPNKYLMEYYFMIKTLEDLDIKKKDVILPYLPYGRQDKVFRLGEPFSLRYILEMFSKNSVSRIYTLMAHLTRLSDIIDITEGLRVVNISLMDSVADYLRGLKLSNPLIVGPDWESERWAVEISQKFETDYIFLDKRRDVNTGEITTRGDIPNLAGRDVVIVDDIISTGKTIENAVKLIQEKKPEAIYVVAVHGIFSNNAIERLSKYNIKIVTSNTIKNPFAKINIGNILARAIKKW